MTIQVPPLPSPALPTTSNEIVAKSAAPIQAQAAKPLLQRAIDPASKSGQGNKTKSNSDKAKGESPKEGERGGSVNIRV